MASTSATDKGRVITLEEFIIDTFTRVGEDGVERPVDWPDEIGGGGSYGIVGARMFLPSHRLGMIIDQTPSTLPTSMRTALDAYGKDMWMYRERTDGHPTTRSVNRYIGDLRGFEYLSKPLLLTPADLLDTPWLSPPGVSAIHMISGLERLEGFESDMRRVRDVVGEGWAPKIVWEPNPADAKPAAIPLFQRITPQIDILSPNHSETLALLSFSTPPPDQLRATLETAARKLLAWKPRVGIVIRAGDLGACYIASGSDEVEWVPAYWSEGAEEGWEGRVVDPTGAGNAFCGAMAAALVEGKGLREAVVWGTVAASFVVQQHGLPVVSVEGGKELWAGEEVGRRVDAMMRRLDVRR